MDIEFNTSRRSRPGCKAPVTRPDGAAPASPRPNSGAAAPDLQSALQQIPLVRPDKVHEARKLVNDEKYPPEAVLDGIAALLAIRLKK